MQKTFDRLRTGRQSDRFISRRTNQVLYMYVDSSHFGWTETTSLALLIAKSLICLTSLLCFYRFNIVTVIETVLMVSQVGL